jgi:hypothetical protein
LQLYVFAVLKSFPENLLEALFLNWVLC